MSSNTSAKPEPAFDVRAREAYITGKPPRIAPLKPNELGKEASESINNLRKALSLPATEGVPEFTAMMLRHPRLYDRHIALALQLFDSALTVRDRELAILRVGWLCKAPFEWGEHVKTGKRMAGITEEEIERMKVGSTAPGWSDHERAIIRAVEELHTDAMISDETWAVLSRTLNDKQLIELPILVGQYQGVAYVQNALRVPLMEGNAGLAAR